MGYQARQPHQEDVPDLNSKTLRDPLRGIFLRPGGQSFAEIARHEKTRELIAGYIDALNAQLNRWEQINRFAIVDRGLSIEAGDLTPSLKLRRKVVVESSQTASRRCTTDNGAQARPELGAPIRWQCTSATTRG